MARARAEEKGIDYLEAMAQETGGELAASEAEASAVESEREALNKRIEARAAKDGTGYREAMDALIVEGAV